jgi:copper(I)-binding protein
MKLSTALFIATALFIGGAACAHDIKAGSLVISEPYLRATAPGAPTAGGYLTVTNHGSETDRLIGGSAGFAEKVEIHEMKMEGDIMKMRRMDGGVEVAPGKSVQLMPGVYHVMFIRLKEQLKDGESRTATLTFEKAGAVDIEFQVRDLTGRMKKTDKHDMKDMKGHKH